MKAIKEFVKATVVGGIDCTESAAAAGEAEGGAAVGGEKVIRLG